LYGGIAETQADEEGRFTVKNIPRDWWVEGVSAEAPGFAPSFAWDEKSYSVIPDQSNVGTPILRLPLEAATITLQRALEVSGRVKIADGSPGQNARVRLYGELPNRPRVGMFQKYTTEERTYVEHTARYRQIVLADADGNYQVSAHPTMFQIDATLDNTASDYHEFVPQSSRPMRNIDLVLQQTGSFSGTVFDVNTGKPAAVSLGAWWEGTSAPWRGQYTKSDGAGRFKFDNCRPGRWSLSERLGKIIMETSFGELAKGNVTFVIEPGQRLANCTIAVQPRDQLEVKMTGIVLDSGGRPVSKVQVTAMGRSAMTNEQGTFKVNLTDPGEVDVTAFDPSSGLSGFATAEVAIGQESSVEVTLTEQPASGSGSIYTKDGKLYDKLVKLRLWLESGEQKIIEAKNGHYDTGPIPPGQHMISVDSDGILATPSEHGGRVAAGQHVDGLDFVVELVEAMQGEVSGTVTYPDGRPAQGIWLQLAGRNIRKNGTTDDNGTFKFAPVGGHMEFRIGRSPDANGRGDSVWAYLDVTGESKDLKIVLEPLGKVVGEIDVDGDSTGPVWLSIQGQRGFHTDIYPVEGPLEASLQQDVYTLRFDTTSDGPKIEEVVIRDVVVESNKITDLGIIEVRLKAVKE
jgi:hypothetical protein